MGGNLEAMAGGHAENAGVAGRQERAPAVPCRPRTHVDGQSPARAVPVGRAGGSGGVSVGEGLGGLLDQAGDRVGPGDRDRVG
ncbi:hypothetical protein ABZ359_42480, partial [Streptomyces sp. NPDC005968]